MENLYFEDFEVGMEFETAGRTVTEADIVNFAAISGDWNPIHTDKEFAKNTVFGERIAHGLLTLAIASGLITRMRLVERTIVAYYGIERLRFTKPVFIGDTIKAVVRVVDREEREKYGIVTFEVNVVKQTGDVVLTYISKSAIKKKGGL
ncbi:MaoC/PaaZ C-terminal domain-containing protein [Geoglobus acetivorans]|uniref:MaoC family dehydratase N-terminal domain-containing protein n=1 Tax=Geoglobus acetivorans TaxID=565033 RepID=A0ABZ3H229_GEOAI|nr:MaoC family dehydratase N-terminal domain-containing protein [Geoglobus acetivorans]